MRHRASCGWRTTNGAVTVTVNNSSTGSLSLSLSLFLSHPVITILSIYVSQSCANLYTSTKFSPIVDGTDPETAGGVTWV